MKIEIPAEVANCEVICSVSGGKDSAALVLALREAEVPARYVFADTAWEHEATYAHLDTMRRVLGITIDVVGVEGGMVARARYRAGFPIRLGRWCTQELKLEPLRSYNDRIIDETGRDTVNAMGVRAEESAKRAQMPIWEFADDWGGFCWRPLLHWTIADVLEIHRRHGLPMNPLYHMGFDRVGCFPCIFAGRNEVSGIARVAPERVSVIADLEREFTALRATRNAEHVAAGKPGLRYKHPQATFFQARDRKDGKPQTILDVVDWAQTARGGRQRLLFDPAPTGGCMRWGMCETPPTPMDD